MSRTSATSGRPEWLVGTSNSCDAFMRRARPSPCVGRGEKRAACDDSGWRAGTGARATDLWPVLRGCRSRWHEERRLPWPDGRRAAARRHPSEHGQTPPRRPSRAVGHAPRPRKPIRRRRRRRPEHQPDGRIESAVVCRPGTRLSCQSPGRGEPLIGAFDRDANSYGIRAVESCRARQYKCSI